MTPIYTCTRCGDTYSELLPRENVALKVGQTSDVYALEGEQTIAYAGDASIAKANLNSIQGTGSKVSYSATRIGFRFRLYGLGIQLRGLEPHRRQHRYLLLVHQQSDLRHVCPGRSRGLRYGLTPFRFLLLPMATTAPGRTFRFPPTAEPGPPLAPIPAAEALR